MAPQTQPRATSSPSPTDSFPSLKIRIRNPTRPRNIPRAPKRGRHVGPVGQAVEHAGRTHRTDIGAVCGRKIRSLAHDAAFVGVIIRLHAVGDAEEARVAAGAGGCAFRCVQVEARVLQAEVGVRGVVAVGGAGGGEGVRAGVDGAGCGGGRDLGKGSAVVKGRKGRGTKGRGGGVVYGYGCGGDCGYGGCGDGHGRAGAAGCGV